MKITWLGKIGKIYRGLIEKIAAGPCQDRGQGVWCLSVLCPVHDGEAQSQGHHQQYPEDCQNPVLHRSTG